ncbi:MAG: EAL domain-containing protein [Cyanobacteria bacterium J06614_10]
MKNGTAALLVEDHPPGAQKRIEQLIRQATYDPVTHLLNRQRFIQLLDSSLLEISQAQSQIHHALCYLDLDHFKAINSLCGYTAGDRLLYQVAELWRNEISAFGLCASDCLGRLGDNAFGLLLYGCDVDRAVEIADRLAATIQTFRFLYNDKIFSVGVSIGLAPIVGRANSTEQVIQLAERACADAKRKGGNRVQLCARDNGDIDQQSEDSQWFSRITQALDNDEFVLYEQAIATTRTETDHVELCEILLRLQETGQSEVVSPRAFIPPAERYNLMPKIDRWVIQNMFEYLATKLPSPAKLYSINLSGSSINDDSFIDFIKEQLQIHAVDTRSLCFEITETVAIANLQQAADFILELKNLGCYFALDDFGSGMSSFSYLRHLPVDFLKIDGTLVREAASDRITCAMLEAINQVGHVMQLKTIAEYVENQPILNKAQELGIDYVQGFAIQRPARLI